jgi:putative peptidoglycan lipid II flippase
MNRIINLVRRYQSYLVVLSFTLLGHGLGFGREVAIAYMFGASSISDGILVGLAPLSFFFSLFGISYVNAAMTRIKSPDNTEQIRQSFYPIIVVSFVVALVFLLFNDLIARLIGPGLRGSGLALAAEIVRFSAISAGITSVYYWFRGVCHLEQKFLKVSIADLMPNIGILIGIFVLYQQFGVLGIAIGITVGFGLQLLVVFDKKRIDLSGFSLAALISEDARIVYRNTMLAAVGVSGVIASLFIDRYFASEVVEGGVASINFAYKVMSLPLSTVVFSIVMVLFPKLIAMRDEHKAFAKVKLKINGVMVLIGLCSAAVLIVFDHQIISLLFERGEFDASDVAATAPLLSIYAAGLVFHALVLFNARACFALEDFKTPLYAGLAGGVSNIVLDFLLVDEYGLSGLAAATSIAAAINAILLVLRKPIIGVKEETRLASSVNHKES